MMFLVMNSKKILRQLFEAKVPCYSTPSAVLKGRFFLFPFSQFPPLGSGFCPAKCLRHLSPWAVGVLVGWK